MKRAHLIRRGQSRRQDGITKGDFEEGENLLHEARHRGQKSIHDVTYDDLEDLWAELESNKVEELPETLAKNRIKPPPPTSGPVENQVIEKGKAIQTPTKRVRYSMLSGNQTNDNGNGSSSSGSSTLSPPPFITSQESVTCDSGKIACDIDNECLISIETCGSHKKIKPTNEQIIHLHQLRFNLERFGLMLPQPQRKKRPATSTVPGTPELRRSAGGAE